MSKRQHLTTTQIATAIRIVQDKLLWKPNSAERHLRRRIKREHLPATTTLDEYEGIIRQIVYESDSQVYIYWYNSIEPYISVVLTIDEQTWLVMFGLDGILESSYVVERPHYYLSEPEFELICVLGDIL